MSEPFRRLSDELLTKTVSEMGKPFHIVGGSVHDRLTKIIDLFELPVVVPIDDAIVQAEDHVAAATKILEDDARFHDAQRKKNFARQLQYALRY